MDHERSAAESTREKAEEIQLRTGSRKVAVVIGVSLR
jgi:hypothetical protein